MSDSADEPPEELPEELEFEVFDALALPPAKRHEKLVELRRRYPEHETAIGVLGGLSDFEQKTSATERLERVGEYTILRVLGEGGMGRVYLARRDGETTPVALKLLRADVENRAIVRRFRREAALLRELRHEAIARFLGSGEADVVHGNGRSARAPYLTMEYVDGRDLLRYANIHQLDDRDRVRLLRRVCLGLAHAHERGIVHRDIKPGNILVAEDGGAGNPKILDFGLAREESSASLSLTMSGPDGLIGTASYMSPEQVEGGAKNLGPRSDVYSFGVVMFELLTGRLPYALDSRGLPEVARIIKEVEPTRLGSAETRFRGTALETILATALEKDPRRRYSNAGTLAADLERYLAGNPIVARDVSALRRAARFAKRHRVLVSTSVGTLVALLVGLAMTLRFAFREAQASERATALAYRTAIAAAAAAIRDRDVATARRLLEPLDAQRCGFEWHHLTAKLDDSLRSASIARDRHRPFPRLRFTSDGDLHAIFYSGGYRSCRLADGPEGLQRVETQALGPDPSPVLSEDGHDIAWFDRDWVTHRFDRPWPATRVTPFSWTRIASAGPATYVCVRPPGVISVRTEDRVITAQLESCPTTTSTIVAHAAAGWIAVGHAAKAIFWRLPDEQGARLRPMARITTPRNQRIRAMTVSDDGRMLAIAGEDGMACLYDTTNIAAPRRTVSFFGHADTVAALAFDRQGKRLASGGHDRTVRVWSTATGAPIRDYVGHESEVDAVAFDDRGARLASMDVGGGIRIWSGESDPRILEHPDTVTAVATHGARLYTGCADGRIRVFDLESSLPIATWQGPWGDDRIMDMTLSRDGSMLVVSAVGNNTHVLRTDGSGTLRQLDLENARSGVFSPDGTRIVARNQRTVAVWDTRTWKRVAQREIESDRQVVFGANGAVIFVATPEAIRMVDAKSLAILGKLESSAAATSLDVAPDGRVAAGHRTGHVRIWDPVHRRLIFEVKVGLANVFAVRFSPDGTCLVSGDNNRATSIWDLERGELIVGLRGHRDFVSDLTFAGGNRLITASGDWTARIRDDVSLGRRLAARRDYQRFAERHAARIGELVANEGSLTALDTWKTWNPREKEVAEQLFLRLRSLR